MKITEVVKHVKRDKLPRDPEWLRNRMFRLISLLWFHHKQIGPLMSEVKAFHTQTPNPTTIVVSTEPINFKAAIDSTNPVFAPPLYRMLIALDGAKLSTRPHVYKFVTVPETFPKIERLFYHLRTYEHIQEDLERTVRSAARLK